MAADTTTPRPLTGGAARSPRGARAVLRAVLVVAVGVQLAMTAVLFDGASWGLTIHHPSRLLPLSAVPFVVGVWALSRAELRARSVAVLVVGVTVALQLLALTRPPLTSNDDLRYIWDGKVQLAGIDPYRYAPDDPALLRLREPALFSTPATDPRCALLEGCALINRPHVHTIYPPVAQVVFDGVRLVTVGGRTGHGGQLGFQISAALGVVVLTLLLLRRARKRGDPPWHAALWGWSPIVVSEFGNNAHIDWAAILLSYAAIAAYVALRPAWSGALLGGAIATKLYPALIAPALLRRHPMVVSLSALGVVAVGYLPHVAAVGGRVIGYLPGYLHEEGYNSGSRLLLLGRIAPHPFDTLLGAVVLATLALWCWRRVDPTRPELTAVWLVGAAFLVMTPNYGWYAGLLVVLVAMTGRWYWLPVAFAPTCTYLYAHSASTASSIYAAAAVAAALGFAVFAATRTTPAVPGRHTDSGSGSTVRMTS